MSAWIHRDALWLTVSTTLLVMGLTTESSPCLAQAPVVSGASEKSLDDSHTDKPSNRFMAEFTDGVKVEFVGLAKMATGEKDPQSWWKPDGSPLGYELKSWGGLAGGDLQYALTVIHIHGINDKNAVSVTSAVSSNHEDQSGSGGPFIANFGMIDVPKGRTGYTFEVGVATEPRSPLRFLDAHGKRLPSSAGSPPDLIAEDITIESIGDVTFGVRIADGQTKFVEPGDRISPDATQVTCQFPSQWQKVDLQMSAIDKEGKAYSTGFDVYTVNLESNDEAKQVLRFAKVFNLPISEVDHFEYQVRLFRHWVTFENVSLQPGKTDVKVSSRTVPKAITAEVPAKPITEVGTSDAVAPKSVLPDSERKGIALIGQIDIDSDGKTDREKLHQKIKSLGFVIDDEIGDDGYPLNQDGAIRSSTRFLVIGTFAPFTDDKHRQRVTEHLSRLRKEARSNGVRTIKLMDFVAYLKRLKETDEYANVLTAFLKKPSVELLTRLLEGTEAKQPEVVELIEDGYDSKGSPVKVIHTETSPYAIVSARVGPVTDPAGHTIEQRFLPQCAFVFDMDGRHIATLGGQYRQKGSHSADWIDVLSLGPDEDWFVRISRFEKNDPFEFQTEYYRIMEPIVKSLRVHHYANSSPWSHGPEQMTRYGTLYFEFRSTRDKFVSRETAFTPNGVAVVNSILWDGDRNRFVGPAEQHAKGKPLYKIDTTWSRDFEDLSPRRDQIVVAGGTRKEGNWHSWHTVVQDKSEAVIKLSIPQPDGPPKIVEKTLSPGAAYFTLEIKEGIDPSVRLFINDAQETFAIPWKLGDQRAASHSVNSVLNSGESATLLHQPLIDSNEEFTFEIQLLKPEK